MVPKTPRVYRRSACALPPVECALVSTSGALLERRQGVEIDDAPRHPDWLCAGDAWSQALLAGGRRRSATRSRRCSSTARRRGSTTRRCTTCSCRWRPRPNARRSGTRRGGAGVCNTRGSRRVHYDRGLGRPPPRCVPTKCACAPKDREIMGLTRKASSGLLGLALAFRLLPECDVVRLWGFGNENESLPYHYWRDGSELDAQSTADQYRLATQNHGHNFRGEHAYVHRVLGGGTWAVGRDAFEGACGRAPANYSRLHRLMRFETASLLVDGCGADGCGAGAEGRAAEVPAAPTAVPPRRAPLADQSSPARAGSWRVVVGRGVGRGVRLRAARQPSHAARTATLAAISLQATGASSRSCACSAPLITTTRCAHSLRSRARRHAGDRARGRPPPGRGATGLEAVGFGAFLDASYTKLAAWNLTEFRVVVCLDPTPPWCAPSTTSRARCSRRRSCTRRAHCRAARGTAAPTVRALSAQTSTQEYGRCGRTGRRTRACSPSSVAAASVASPATRRRPTPFFMTTTTVSRARCGCCTLAKPKADKEPPRARRAGLRDADAHVVHRSGVHKPWSTARPHDAIASEQLLRFNHPGRGVRPSACASTTRRRTRTTARRSATSSKGTCCPSSRASPRGASPTAHCARRGCTLRCTKGCHGVRRPGLCSAWASFRRRRLGRDTMPPNASAAADALPIVDVGAEPRHTGDCSVRPPRRAGGDARGRRCAGGTAARNHHPPARRQEPPCARHRRRQCARAAAARPVVAPRCRGRGRRRLRCVWRRFHCARGEPDGRRAAATLRDDGRGDRHARLGNVDGAVHAAALARPRRDALRVHLLPLRGVRLARRAAVGPRDHKGAPRALGPLGAQDARPRPRPTAWAGPAAALEGAWSDMVTALNPTIPPAACARVSLRSGLAAPSSRGAPARAAASPALRASSTTAGRSTRPPHIIARRGRAALTAWSKRSTS